MKNLSSFKSAKGTHHMDARERAEGGCFQYDGDREMLMATLAETVGCTGWKVHASVWMSDHDPC